MGGSIDLVGVAVSAAVRAFAVLGILAALAVSGCAGPGASETGAPSAPSAPSHNDDGLASIVGTVIDEELSPVAGALVALHEPGLETRTDEVGAFAFHQLQVGEYRLIVQALGYESVGRLVRATEGEVLEVSVGLTAIAIDREPYYDAQPKTSFLQLDQEWLSFVFILANQNWSTLCGTCIHTVFLEPEPVEVLVENVWDESGTPKLNERISIWWRYYDPAGEYHNALESYGNRESREMGQETTELRESKATNFTMSVHSDLETISVNHRIETWNTFAYGGPLPKDYTALPPP